MRRCAKWTPVRFRSMRPRIRSRHKSKRERSCLRSRSIHIAFRVLSEERLNIPLESEESRQHQSKGLGDDHRGCVACGPPRGCISSQFTSPTRTAGGSVDDPCVPAHQGSQITIHRPPVTFTPKRKHTSPSSATEQRSFRQ